MKHQPLIGYMTGSLFDPGGAENQNERPTYIFAEDKHLQQYTETYSLVKFGAFWMDYLFTMDEQDDKGTWNIITDLQYGLGEFKSYFVKITSSFIFNIFCYFCNVMMLNLGGEQREIMS